MTDASDTPFYLFAADLIFSGELNDEEAGVSGSSPSILYARARLEFVRKDSLS